MAPYTPPTANISATSTEMDTGHLYIISAISVLMLIGAVLNFVAFFTYLRKRRRKPTHIYTMCLAIVDFFNCLVLSLAILRLIGVSWMFENAASTMQPYLTYSGTMASGVLVISIAFERHSKVSSPFLVVAREKYWIFVLFAIIIGLLLPFAIPLYRAVGYNKVWMPVHLHHKHTAVDYNATDILTDPGVLIPVIFYGFILFIFLVGYALICVQYAKLTRLIISKRVLRCDKSRCKTDRNSNTVILHKRKLLNAAEGVCHSAEGSSTCSMYHGDGSKDDLSDFKVKDSAVFSIYSSDYYRNLSQIITHPPETVTHQKRPKEMKRDTVRRRTSSLSIAKRSRSRSPLRTIFMLCLALMAFLFYFPNLFVAMLNFIKPSVKEGLSFEMHFVFGVLEYSYIFAFILNPILYTFCNFGFRVDFIRAFGCRSLCGRSFGVPASPFSTPRSSATIHGKGTANIPSKNTANIPKISRTHTRTCGRNDKTQTLPFISELESRLLHGSRT